MSEQTAIYLHLSVAAPALLLGAVQFLRVKGDRPHRRLGVLWVALMAATAISSFWINEGGFSWIHLLSIVILVTLLFGVRAIRRGDRAMHARLMRNSFIGLLVAFAFTFLPNRLLGGLVFGG